MARTWVPGRCHEWREISPGMVTLGLAEKTGLRCAECGQFVDAARDFGKAAPCRERFVSPSWLPQKREAA